MFFACYASCWLTVMLHETIHCNVGTLLQPFKPMSQQCCNAVLHYKSLLRVIQCNITLRDSPIVINNSRCGKYSNAKNEARAES